MKTVSLLAVLLVLGCGSSSESGGGSGGSAGSAGSGGSGGAGGSSGAGGESGSGGSAGTGGGSMPVERVVFVTAAIQAANFGGFEGADAICAREASDAGLTGEFKAWLSSLETPASSRLTRSTVPYVLVDGLRVADDWDDLTDNEIQTRIDLDAMGRVQGGDVWTGTLPSGESYPDGDCDVYTSNAGAMNGLCGSTQQTDARWSATTTPPCSARLRLFCFEQ